MKDISQNIKKVMIIFLLLFLGLIVYMTYFEVFLGSKLVTRADNGRLWAKRNAILRGVIYDRNMKPLAESSKNGEKQIRKYLYNDLFVHTLGYENEKYGLTGMEKRYDKELMALDSIDIYNVFNFKNKDTEKKGYNLITSLDYNIQKKAYDLLGDNKGAVVVLNPKTGEVLAMVSKPGFNPNELTEDKWKAINKDEKFPLINRAVSGMYPPGSVFKTVTAVSALENIDGMMNKRIQDNGKIVFNSREKLSNYGGEVLGNINFQQAFVHSSNVYFGTLGMEMGNSKLKETAEKFFFNKSIPSIGITIDNSRFPKYKDYEKGNIAQSAIGQSGVLATPMQMAVVASTIANDGVMMKPKIVNKVTNSKGNTMKNISPENIGQITSKQNADIIEEFMRKTVQQGTARAAKNSNVAICGKTGTADHKDDGSKNSTPHSWFIGFAPYQNPEIAIAVIVENGGTGGGSATRIATEVINEAIKK
ncbi:penicillin-binding transpeptidase domain-containing protein [Clostridium sp. KNHs214]|uniref:peptidoglycan D,D-transpeptidase FtsI family protein n=1 Tax=Clostridium sp. KNHs214 TaxID=1540257 RepID=UPI000551D5C1|nr:penicillin-binding transpeptidase domain-containing protein [Clostridium sp. KNHs214]